MLTGDELLHKRGLFLCGLLDRGAVSVNSATEPEDLRSAIDVTQLAFESLYLLLYDAKLIHGAPPTKLWLSDRGLGEAKAIQSARDAQPRWRTKQAPEEIQKRVPYILKTIENWIPRQRYRSEEAYEAALAEHLPGQGIEASEQQGKSLTDILAAHGIGIEVELNPDRSEYDRLSGQIIRQLEEFGVVVVLIVRPDKRDLLEEYKARFECDNRVTFITK
jgi:hypothetical protein